MNKDYELGLEKSDGNGTGKMYTGQYYSYNGGLDPYFNRGDGLEYGDGKGGSNERIIYEFDTYGGGEDYGDYGGGGFGNRSGHYYKSWMSD